MNSKKYLVFLCFLFTMLLSCEVMAQITLGTERLRLSGFGTLGLTKGGDKMLGYRRDMSKEGVFDGDITWKQDSLFGLQLDAQLASKFDATVQLILKDRVDNSFEKSVEWAFLRYSITPDLALRVGRLGVDLFMLSEYRNVGFAYLWAHPPTDFYGSIAFDHADGADISYSFFVDDHRFILKAFGGISESTYVSELGDIPLDLNPAFGASLTWEFNDLRARLGLVSTTMDSTIGLAKQLQDYTKLATVSGWPGAAVYIDDLESEGSYVNYYSAGVAYDDGGWLAQGELSYMDTEYGGYRPLFSSYLSLGRRFGAFTPFVLWGYAKSTEDLPEISGAPEEWAMVEYSLQEFFRRGRVDQQSLSFGARWDVRHDIALKFQWDHTWVGAEGAVLWQQRVVPEDDRSLDTFSLNLNFIF